jgi:hypothetical protein
MLEAITVCCANEVSKKLKKVHIDKIAAVMLRLPPTMTGDS